MPGIKTNIEAGTRGVDDFRPAADIGDVLDDDAVREIVKFEGAILTWAERQLQATEAARDETAFNARQKLNTQRGRMALEQWFTKEGTLVENKGDGQAVMGLTLGLSKQAITRAGVHFKRGLFDASSRPFSIKGMGNRDENNLVEEMVGSVLDDMLWRGNFQSKGRLMAGEAPRTGTAVIRMEMERQVTYKPIPHPTTGEEIWKESAVSVKPSFEVWPIADALFTHVDLPGAEDQEGVIWRRRNTSLIDLEKNEALVGPGGSVTGRFRNLGLIRDMVSTASPPTHRASTGGTITSGSPTPVIAGVTSFPSGTLLEHNCCPPIEAFVREGLVTWNVANFFGINVGFDPDPEDDDQMKQWGRRLARIRSWRLSWITDWSGAPREQSAGGTGRILLQFEPSRETFRRNSAYIFKFLQDAQRLHGFSVTDLGLPLERAADAILNADTKAADYNGDPGFIYDTNLLDNPEESEVEKLLQQKGKGVKSSARGSDTGQLLSFMEKPRAPDVYKQLETMIKFFEQASTVPGSTKGTDPADATGTLGEIELNLAQGTIVLDDAVKSMGIEMSRMFLDLFSLTQDALTLRRLPDEIRALGAGALDDSVRTLPFVSYVEAHTGMAATDIQNIMPTLEGIRSEVRIAHPAIFTVDRVRHAQALIAAFKMSGGAAFPDLGLFFEELLTLQGFPRAKEVLGRGQGMDPIDEERQMALGNYISPRTYEPTKEHIVQHLATLHDLQRAAKQGPLREDQKNMLRLLKDHLQETMIIEATKAAALEQIQRAEAGGGAGGQGGEGRDTTAPGRSTGQAEDGRAGTSAKGKEKQPAAKPQAAAPQAGKDSA